MPIWIYIVGGLGLLGVVALVVVVVMGRRQATVEQRLGQFTGTAAAPAPTVKSSERKSALADGLNRLIAGRAFTDNIARDLARADIKFTPAEFIALQIIIAFAVTLGVGFLQQNLLIGLLVGLPAAWFGPRIWVNNQKAARLSRFDQQLADMLNLCVNGLRAGYSVTQALESVGRELPPPISVEFKRVVQEMQLGIPMEQALTHLTDRIPSKDLDFVVTAINVQREVGGNLAEILDTISFTIRERVRIKGEIASLTAQGMMTGYVISLLPFGLGLFLFLINRPYMLQFVVDPKTMQTDNWTLCGIIAIVIAVLLIGGGFFIVMKIVDIEV